LFVNGTKDPSFDDFERAQRGRFGQILRRAGSQIHLETVDGRIAACADAGVQQPVVNLITAWLTEGRESTTRAEVADGHV